MKKNIYKCRFCDGDLNSTDLALNLSKMPLTDNFLNYNSSFKDEFLEDINIYVCSICNLTQNPKDFDYSNYYINYNYSSGHSDLTLNFMNQISKYITDKYSTIFNKVPNSVIEIGSGDGVQLNEFKKLGYKKILGIEPSSYLAKMSNLKGIPVIEKIFDSSIEDTLDYSKFDICLSSYTFDHMPNPKDYLDTCYNIMNEKSILVIEIHDLDKIIQRNEWCLFEHEHTIYLNKDMSKNFLLNHGFEIIDVNPLKHNIVRANSLIIIARKLDLKRKSRFLHKNKIVDISSLQTSITQTIYKVDEFVKSKTNDGSIIGFGAGGRGVMTLASLNNSNMFEAIFDSNFKKQGFYTPKSHIPILAISDLHKYFNSNCIVFSFGYFNEISNFLLSQGFSSDKIISLESFYNC